MSQATRILLALVAGLLLGIGAAAALGSRAGTAVAIAEPVGALWLNGLQMTIIPLVVSLLITGIAATAEAARAGRLTVRALIAIFAVLCSSALLAALLTPLLLDLWPLQRAAADALRGALAGSASIGAVPPFGDFIRSIVPSNAVAAAAEGQILPLIVFTLAFAFALTRVPAGPRARLTDFFQAVSDVMLVMIGWMLRIAPVGVFALAFAVGARTGSAAFGALLHYVIIVSAVGIAVWLLAYPLAVIGGRVGLVHFARAMAPAQAVAISTQSSLASLPAMLRSAEILGVPVAASGVVLPLAVALFRATGPAMNLAVAIYVAHWFGMPLGPGQLAIGVVAAAITTMGAVSLPGQVSFFTSIVPISLAMGVPVEALALLIAVETIPDIFRTLGNVTMDVGVTMVATRGEPAEASEQDALLGSDG